MASVHEQPDNPRQALPHNVRVLPVPLALPQLPTEPVAGDPEGITLLYELAYLRGYADAEARLAASPS